VQTLYIKTHPRICNAASIYRSESRIYLYEYSTNHKHRVLIDAVSERMRLSGLSTYAAVKAGLEVFAEAPRKEERKRRVLVVLPGAVSTEFRWKVPFKMPGNALSSRPRQRW
jgi:short-subunit dehydrogenase